jgi:anti-sigma-K factor RskA
MASMTHDELRELSGSYALDALSEVDRQAFETHLSTCADCTREVQEFRAVASALPFAVPQIDPPAALRDRVLRTAVAPGVVIPIKTRPAKAEWTLPAWLSVAASFAAVALGLYTLTLRQRIDLLEERLRDANARVEESAKAATLASLRADRAEEMTSVLAAGDVRRIDLVGQKTAPGAAGYAFWSPSRRVLLFSAANLPALSPGRQYQLWVIPKDGKPVSAGLLNLDQRGRVIALADSPNADPGTVAVSEEPAGGVPQPTGPVVLAGAI